MQPLRLSLVRLGLQADRMSHLKFPVCGLRCEASMTEHALLGFVLVLLSVEVTPPCQYHSKAQAQASTQQATGST